MASKKSKVLAIAFCAAVMTGIYAAPVMAAAINVSDTSTLEVSGNDGNKYTITSGTLNLDGGGIATALTDTDLTLNSVTANTISTKGINAGSSETFKLGQINVTGQNLSNVGWITASDTINTPKINGVEVSGDGDNGLTISQVELKNGLVNGVDVTKLNANVGGITRTDVTGDGTPGNGTTTIETSTKIDANGMTVGDNAIVANTNGSFSAVSGDFGGTVINAQGINAGSSETFKLGQINVTGQNLSNVGWITASDTINTPKINGVEVSGDGDNGLTISSVELKNGLVDGVDVSKLSTAATDISDLQNRTQYITGASNDTTYFKGAIRSTGDISSGNGAVTLSGNYKKEAAVTLRDAEGKRYALTATQLGNINNMITGAGVLENVVSINGAAVEGVGNGGLKISGVELENGLINGVNINDLDKAVAGTSANIGGIEREAEDGAAPGEGTTTIENNLKVSGDKINMFGDAGLTFDEGTMNGVNVISVSGNIGFNGSNVHFSYGSDGKTTTLGGLALTVDQIATDVSAIKEKTDHITVDDKGNVTISADDGSSLTVGKDGTSTGQGGQVTTDGNHTVNGDLDVDGSGQIDKDLTVGGDLEVGGSITTGNTTIDGSGMTVGDGTTITDGKVSSTEGAFGNITSNTGNIGNATFDENGMTVGTADKGTTVSDSGVSIKNEYGSVETGVVDGKNDVVVTDEDGNRTSLVDTAGRVENLEQGVAELNNRVGELEDRIDKVGAMAAAIANLRTMGYDPAAPTEVAVGLGQYRDETGAALGLFHYPNRDFMLSLSVSTSGDEVMGGIGATWKFGRKSPEKVAEIKKAQAEADARRAEEAKLAKAEEMKQAAKEAKIKAQQERHAKLAAERAAQAEAAK